MAAAAALAVALVVTCAGGALAQQPLAGEPEAQNVLSWPRAGVERFGCMLERAFGTRPARFNCDLAGYVNRGDPCRNAEAYYEGPRFSADGAARVSPAIARIALAYEGGRVQSVTLVLKQRQTESAIRVLLGLPQPGEPLPANVTTLSVQGCRSAGGAQLCDVVYLEGFEHLGAGDVECREDDVPPEPTTVPTAPASPSE